MADIVVTAIRPQDRRAGPSYGAAISTSTRTELPPEIYEHTWQRLIAAEKPRSADWGARLGSDTATARRDHPLSLPCHAWMTQEVCYLQDLFVDATSSPPWLRPQTDRGRSPQSRAERGCARLYW